MPTLSSAGVGSGLDINGLVAQLVAAERSPVATRLARQEASVELQLTAFGAFRSALAAIDSALDGLVDAADLNGRSASSEDSEVFTASASAGAPLGQFDVQVERLAEGHRLASTTALASADQDVGYGTLSLQLGSDSFDVVIDSAAQSLADVRDAINAAADNPGIVATIIQADAGAILQLSSDRTGTTSEIQLSSSGGDGNLNTLIADLGQTQAFVDAQVYLNGNLVTSGTNTISSAIEGVTLNLLEARVGEVYSLDIGRDNQQAVDALQALVNAYNGYASQAKALGGFDAQSGQGGPLNGDSVLRSVNSQLRLALSANYGNGGISSLTDLGISIEADGQLSLDQGVLTEALADDFAGVQSFLEGEQGFAGTLATLTGQYIDEDGVIGSRLEGLNSRLDRIESQNEALGERMARLEARYLAQFSALDALLARLQQTSAYLSQQLSNLPGVGGSNNN